MDESDYTAHNGSIDTMVDAMTRMLGSTHRQCVRYSVRFSMTQSLRGERLMI